MILIILVTSNMIEMWFFLIVPDQPSNTRSLVVSNIQSMADGVYFWGKGPNTKKDIKEYVEPNSGDGQIEVMAAKGLYKYIQVSAMITVL